MIAGLFVTPRKRLLSGVRIVKLAFGKPLLVDKFLVLAILILSDFDIPMPKNLNLAQMFLFYVLYISVATKLLFVLVRQEIFLTASPFTKSPDLGRIILYSERILTS